MGGNKSCPAKTADTCLPDQNGTGYPCKWSITNQCQNGGTCTDIFTNKQQYQQYKDSKNNPNCCITTHKSEIKTTSNEKCINN